MNKLIRGIAAAISIVTMFTGVNVLTATPASAACGSACDFKNPAYNNCSADAKTVRTAWTNSTDPWVDLRYSPTCRTAWAFSPFVSSNPYLDLRISSFYDSSGLQFRTESFGKIEFSGQYGFMLNDAGLYARACLINWDNWHQYYTVGACTTLY